MNQDALYDALLDALYATFGQHPGFRVAHAKGLLLSGTFVASTQARTISRAAHLQGEPVAVMARFSNFSGLPGTADGDPMASPHGLAIRFALPDGSSTDIVSHSFNGFPVATPQAFLAFLRGIAANGGSTPDERPLQAFLATHAQARAFLETPKPAPRSYAGIAYYGVNAFQFINGEGQLHVGRYRIEPMLASGVLSPSQAAAMPEDYLQEELAARLAAGPIRLRLVLQLATARDNSADGSIAWPASNPQLELGEITLERLVPAADQLQQQQRMGFNPGNLPDGISPSADPMIKARQGIYQRALLRRGVTSPAGD